MREITQAKSMVSVITSRITKLEVARPAGKLEELLTACGARPVVCKIAGARKRSYSDEAVFDTLAF